MTTRKRGRLGSFRADATRRSEHHDEGWGAGQLAEHVSGTCGVCGYGVWVCVRALGGLLFGLLRAAGGSHHENGMVVTLVQMAVEQRAIEERLRRPSTSLKKKNLTAP